MKERPILMRGPLVLASLEDRKTQTRRVIVPQPDPAAILDGGGWLWNNGKVILGASDGLFQEAMLQHCPYGGVGDRLWVRETFSIVPMTAYRASTGVQQTINPSDPDDAAIYRAGWDRSDPGTRWRPSIHMPRWASRLTLEITGVAVERLQEITAEDKEAEGLNEDQGYGPAAFADMWDTTTTNPAHRWAANPWVWVITYRRIAHPPAAR